jgi:hypothetical protein
VPELKDFAEVMLHLSHWAGRHYLAELLLEKAYQVHDIKRRTSTSPTAPT